MNRMQDALLVLGDVTPEVKSMVEEIEKEIQSQPVNKSTVSDLIYKSIQEVENAQSVEKSFTELVKIYGDKLGQPTLIELLKKMTEDGIVTEDELSKRINEMVNAMTDKSLSSENVEKSKLEEKCDPTVYKPYGGAMTLNDAKGFVDAIKTEDAVYKVYSMFGAVAQNLMSSDDSVENKMSRMQGLLSEFKNSLTPQALETYKSEVEIKEEVTQETQPENTAKEEGEQPVNSLESQFEDFKNTILTKLEELGRQHPANVESNETTQENIVEEISKEKSMSDSSVKELVSSLDNLLKQSVEKSGVERQQAFQNVLNYMGEQLTLIDKSLADKEVNLESLKSMGNNSFDEKFAEIKKSQAEQNQLLQNQIAQLSTLVQNVLTTKGISPKQLEVPVSKSIQHPTGIPKQQFDPFGVKPMKIGEIAVRTTALR